MDAGLQALFWFVLKKRTRNSRLTARAILQRSASEIMYQIRRKTRLTVLLLTALVLHFTVERLLCLVMGIVMRYFFRYFFLIFFFFWGGGGGVSEKNVTELYRKKGERLHVEKKTKNVGAEPFFIGSVPKGVHSCLWTFLGTERIKLERVKYHLHVKFCRSRSSFYPSRSNFLGRVNGRLVLEFVVNYPVQSFSTFEMF